MIFLRILKFDFLNILKTPMLVLMNTLFPLILFASFGLATSPKFGGSIATSYDFYGVATMIMSGMFVSMSVTNTFMERTIKLANMRTLYAPLTKTDIYLSKLLSNFIFASISFTVICLIEQFIFGCNFGGRNIAFVIFLIILLTLFGCSFGTLACCILKSEEKANALMPIISILFIFFGGIFIPIGHLGRISSSIANLSPIKWVTECIYQIIYDGNFKCFADTCVMLVTLSIICVALCNLTFKPEDYI